MDGLDTFLNLCRALHGSWMCQEPLVHSLKERGDVCLFWETLTCEGPVDSVERREGPSSSLESESLPKIRCSISDGLLMLGSSLAESYDSSDSSPHSSRRCSPIPAQSSTPEESDQGGRISSTAFSSCLTASSVSSAAVTSGPQGLG